MSQAEGLAKFGLFLSLSWIVPGIVYVGFVALYFPDAPEQFGWDLDSWTGLVGTPVFLGLLITSVCFSLEALVIWPIFDKMQWEKPEIPLMGFFEAKGLSTFYINQVLGQYVMHLNVSLGVLLLLVAYVLGPYLFNSHFLLTEDSLLKIYLGSLVSVVNLYLSLGVFRRFSIRAIEGYEKAAGMSKSAVVFDLDNTLIDTYSVYWNAKHELAKEIRKLGGRMADERKFVDEMFKIDRELCKRFHTRNYDQRELIKEACIRADCKGYDLEELTRGYNENLKEKPRAFDRAKETLTALKNKGSYLVLLSEGIKEKGERTLEIHGFRKLFDDIQFVTRKEKERFDLIVKSLRDKGYTRIYCAGDSIASDITYGNSAGAETIWIPSEWEVKRPEKTEEWPKYRIERIEDILKIVDDQNSLTSQNRHMS